MRVELGDDGAQVAVLRAKAGGREGGRGSVRLGRGEREREKGTHLERGEERSVWRGEVEVCEEGGRGEEAERERCRDEVRQDEAASARSPSQCRTAGAEITR